MRPMFMTRPALLATLLAFTCGAAAGADAALVPDAAALEAAGAHIGTITVRSTDIFDLSDPAENRALYRLANRWHIRTREGVLRAQLLFAAGDRDSHRLLADTETNLRGLRFLRGPSVSANAGRRR